MADFKQITVGGVSHPVKDEVARQGLAGKQDKLTFDDTPTANSNNPVKSGGVFQAIQSIDVSGQISGKEDKSNKVTSFSSPTDTQYPSAKLVSDQLATKQGTISDLSTIRSGAAAGATAYQKPGTGIPPTDLASAVQTSLGKADTAIQSVTVGTTTTGAAGSSASVTNTGTATAPVLSFTIPQGAQGIQGIQGPQGERGPQGNTGVQVDSVASIIHSIDPTATYAAADVAGADAVQDVLSEVTELGGEVYNAIDAHSPISYINELDATYTQGYHWNSSMVLTKLSKGNALAMEIDVSDCVGRTFTYTGTKNISTSTSASLRSGIVKTDDSVVLLTASALQSYTIPSDAKYLRISFSEMDITGISFTIPYTASPASEEMVLAKAKIRKTLTQEDVEMTSGGYYNASGEFVSRSGYVSFMHDITGYEGGVYDCSSMTMASGYLGFVLTDDSVVAYKTAVDKLRVPSNAKYVFGGWYNTSASGMTFSVTSYYGLEDIAGKSDLDKLVMSLSDGTIGVHDKYDLTTLTTNIHVGYYWSVSGQDIVRTTTSDILAFKMNVENYRGWVLHYSGIQTTTNGGNSFVTGSGDVIIYKANNTITIPNDATVLGLTLRASVDYNIYLISNEESAILSENALQRAVDTLNSRISSIETSTGTLPSNTVWYVLGDSNSASGLYASHKYYNYIAVKNNIESNLHVLAGDGNAWGVNGNYGTIYSQAQRIGQDATLITIWAGSNDFNHAQTEIGTWPAGDNGYAPVIPSTFAECSTFYEYVLFDLNYIQTQFPSATIALIIPLGKTNTTTVGGETYTMDKFSRVIKECAEYYGLPVIPLGWEVGFGGAKKRDLYVDQAHLNNKGQRKAAAFIESYLRMILNEVPEIAG